MWGWLTPFMVAMLVARGSAHNSALAMGGMLAAGAIGLGGAVGAVAGGRLSDRLGRPETAKLMLAVGFVGFAGFGGVVQTPPGPLLPRPLLFWNGSPGGSPPPLGSPMEGGP